MAGFHQVKQGEYLSLIARRYGFPDWHAIYDHAENAELRRRRPNPNVLQPGDRIYIPDRGSRKVNVASGRSHKFTVKTCPLPILRLALKEQSGKPLAKAPCTLEIQGEKIAKQTDTEGKLEHRLPAGVETVKLTIDRWAVTWDLDVGHLDPVEDPHSKTAIVSGVQARLNNLGFECGDVDGILGPRTRNAVKLFQLKVMKRDPPSGEPDEDTRAALLQHHLA